jgi:cell division inhibitor SulA
LDIEPKDMNMMEDVGAISLIIQPLAIANPHLLIEIYKQLGGQWRWVVWVASKIDCSTKKMHDL